MRVRQPRSGLAARHGITIVNAPGSSTRAIAASSRSSCSTPTARSAFTVEPGMRIAQLVVCRSRPSTLVEVDELAESERGVRGFGSSAH